MSDRKRATHAKGLQEAYAELQEAAALLMAQYEIEEDEHGFPFNFRPASRSPEVEGGPS